MWKNYEIMHKLSNVFNSWLYPTFVFSLKRTINRGNLQTQGMVTHQEVGEGTHNRDEESDERRAVGTPPDLAEIVRSLMVELQSCKADNERMMKEQEK